MKITYRRVHNTEKAKAAVVVVDGIDTQLFAVREDLGEYNLYFKADNGAFLRLTTWYFLTRELLQTDVEKRLMAQQESLAA